MWYEAADLDKIFDITGGGLLGSMTTSPGLQKAVPN